MRNLPRVFTPQYPAENRTRDLLISSSTPYLTQSTKKLIRLLFDRYVSQSLMTFVLTTPESHVRDSVSMNGTERWNEMKLDSNIEPSLVVDFSYDFVTSHWSGI